MSYFLIDEWKKEMTAKLKLVHPEWKKDDIHKKLDAIIEREFKDHKCSVRNTYKGQEAETSLMNVAEFIHVHKPIIAGYGMMCKKHGEAPNPASGMLQESIDNRDIMKAKMKKSSDPYEAQSLDRAQGNEKVIPNSFYGALGASTSVFFNRDLAATVTSTGQALISHSETSFEAFMENNTKFYDMDECLLFIHNVIHKDKYTRELEPIEDAYDKAYEKLENTFAYSMKFKPEILQKVLSNLDDMELTKLYYKNNLYTFLKEVKPVKKLLMKLVINTKEFMDPNKVPEEIEPDLEELWAWLEEWVAYDHSIRNQIERDKYDTRRSAILQDTDSTMVTILELMDLMYNMAADTGKDVAAKTEDDFDFILCNISAYILTRWCQVFLARYCKIRNIPKDYWKKIKMKNEFYYPILVNTDAKKHYITQMKMREGKKIDPPKSDMHGLELTKAECPDATKDFFNGIINNDVMNTDRIDVSKILRKIRDFRIHIQEAVHSGDTSFYPIKSVKIQEAYSKPYSEQGFRAVYAWNVLYPKLQIQLPDKVFGVQLDLAKPKLLEAHKSDIPEDIYEAIQKYFFQSGNKTLETNGLNIIALPQNIEKIPDWILACVNIKKIVENNVSKFNPILKSLGSVNLFTKAGTDYMSNLIDL